MLVDVLGRSGSETQGTLQLGTNNRSGREGTGVDGVRGMRSIIFPPCGV